MSSPTCQPEIRRAYLIYIKYMSKKIFITRMIPQVGIDMLRAAGFEVDIFPKSYPPPQRNLISYLKEGKYDGMISLLTDAIDAKLFAAAPSLKIVSTYAAGYNNIDTEEAKRRGVAVANTPRVSSLPVAEHAIALMLALTTRLVEGDEYVRFGKYKGWSAMNFMGSDVCGKTFGLVGVGQIGSHAARIASKGFGMNIIYHDLVENKEVETECGAKRVATLEELLATADVVSLHVPLLPSTRHLISADKMKLMKPSAFLINTSRGPVIDEKALVAALKNGTIKGAGLDVFEFEPKLVPGLAKLSNVVLTPHIASAREAARINMSKVAAQNIIDFFEGKTPVGKIV